MTPETACIEWPLSTNNKGYGMKKVGGKRVLAHRWAVAEVLGWGAIQGKVVMHECDNRRCYRFDHLRVATHAENMADMVAKGRSLVGESHPRSRLKTSDVVSIKARRSAGESLTSIADQFKIAVSHVHAITNGRAWSHIQTPPDSGSSTGEPVGAASSGTSESEST